MASSSSNYQRFGADPYLLPNQQDLLVAALSSQAPGSSIYENESRIDQFRGKEGSEKQRPNSIQQGYSAETSSSAVVAQPDLLNSDALAALNADDPSFVDWLNTNDDLAYEAIDNGQAWADEQDGIQSGLPAITNIEEEPEVHDKRKNPSDVTDDGEGNGNKRREGEEKVAKKPGRKPLISEASTVSLDIITYKALSDSCLEAQGTESGGPEGV